MHFNQILLLGYQIIICSVAVFYETNARFIKIDKRYIDLKKDYENFRISSRDPASGNPKQISFDIRPGRWISKWNIINNPEKKLENMTYHTNDESANIPGKENEATEAKLNKVTLGSDETRNSNFKQDNTFGTGSNKHEDVENAYINFSYKRENKNTVNSKSQESASPENQMRSTNKFPTGVPVSEKDAQTVRSIDSSNFVNLPRLLSRNSTRIFGTNQPKLDIVEYHKEGNVRQENANIFNLKRENDISQNRLPTMNFLENEDSNVRTTLGLIPGNERSPIVPTAFSTSSNRFFQNSKFHSGQSVEDIKHPDINGNSKIVKMADHYISAFGDSSHENRFSPRKIDESATEHNTKPTSGYADDRVFLYEAKNPSTSLTDSENVRLQSSFVEETDTDTTVAVESSNKNINQNQEKGNFRIFVTEKVYGSEVKPWSNNRNQNDQPVFFRRIQTNEYLAPSPSYRQVQEGPLYSESENKRQSGNRTNYIQHESISAYDPTHAKNGKSKKLFNEGFSKDSPKKSLNFSMINQTKIELERKVWKISERNLTLDNNSFIYINVSKSEFSMILPWLVNQSLTLDEIERKFIGPSFFTAFHKIQGAEKPFTFLSLCGWIHKTLGKHKAEIYLAAGLLALLLLLILLYVILKRRKRQKLEKEPQYKILRRKRNAFSRFNRSFPSLSSDSSSEDSLERRRRKLRFPRARASRDDAGSKDSKGVLNRVRRWMNKAIAKIMKWNYVDEDSQKSSVLSRVSSTETDKTFTSKRQRMMVFLSPRKRKKDKRLKKRLKKVTTPSLRAVVSEESDMSPEVTSQLLRPADLKNRIITTGDCKKIDHMLVGRQWDRSLYTAHDIKALDSKEDLPDPYEPEDKKKINAAKIAGSQVQILGTLSNKSSSHSLENVVDRSLRMATPIAQSPRPLLPYELKRKQQMQ